MSDTFDHEGDAWDSYEAGLEDQDPDYAFTGRGKSNFVRNPLYYHERLSYRKMVGTTEMAVQLELMDGRLLWIPRSVCREWSEHQVWVHRRTLHASLKNARMPVNHLDALPDMGPEE